jgi:hypothetical protein
MYADPHPAQYRQHQDRLRNALLHTSAALISCVALIAAVVAGTGWLYLLRDLHGLAFGPAFSGALPLQQLAGGDAQPLGRMVVAWLPTGLALGVVLGAATRMSRPLRATLAAVGSAVLLLFASAVSDAVAQNDTVRQHISGSLSRSGIWLAVALLTLGVLISPPWARRGEAAAASPS